MKYNKAIVIAFFREHDIPTPKTEFQFHATRKWKFDFAWPDHCLPVCADTPVHFPLALEVDGGIWIRGGHNRGAQMLKTWEKENEAVCMGWRILRCQPKDLCTTETATLIKRALEL